jgi:hypothetical protein
MIRDVDLAYRNTDDIVREVHCPECLILEPRDDNEVIKIYKKLYATRKAIGRRLQQNAQICCIGCRAAGVNASKASKIIWHIDLREVFVNSVVGYKLRPV